MQSVAIHKYRKHFNRSLCNTDILLCKVKSFTYNLCISNVVIKNNLFRCHVEEESYIRTAAQMWVISEKHNHVQVEQLNFFPDGDRTEQI